MAKSLIKPTQTATKPDPELGPAQPQLVFIFIFLISDVLTDNLYQLTGCNQRILRLLQDLFLSAWRFRTRPKKSKTCNYKGNIKSAFFSFTG